MKYESFAANDTVTWADHKNSIDADFIRTDLRPNYGEGPFVVLHVQDLSTTIGRILGSHPQKLYVGKKVDVGPPEPISNIFSAYWFTKVKE